MNWNKLLLPLQNERGGFFSSIGKGFKKLTRGIGRTIKGTVKGLAQGGIGGAISGGLGTAIYGQSAMQVGTAEQPPTPVDLYGNPITRPAGAYPVAQVPDRTRQGAAFGELFKGNTMILVLGGLLVVFLLAKK